MTRKATIALLCSAVALAAAGCGTSHSVSHAGTGPGRAAGSAGSSSAFAWLRPAPPPAGWSHARLLGSTVLAYPRNFSRIESDPGTVSAARVDRRSGLILEYLNATPREGDETLANWASFRPAHNREEGDSHEQVLASARGLRFRDGRGSCVIDRYATSRTSYQEIACLVRGPTGESVIVATAQASRWAQSAPALERAVSAFAA